MFKSFANMNLFYGSISMINKLSRQERYPNRNPKRLKTAPPGLLLVGFTISVEERIIPEHSSRVDSDYKYITTELKYD